MVATQLLLSLYFWINEGNSLYAHPITLIIDRIKKRNFPKSADQIKSNVNYFQHSVFASDQLRSEQLAERKEEEYILMKERFTILSSSVVKILVLGAQHNVSDMVATTQLNIFSDLVSLLGPFKIVTETWMPKNMSQLVQLYY